LNQKLDSEEGGEQFRRRPYKDILILRVGKTVGSMELPEWELGPSEGFQQGQGRHELFDTLVSEEFAPAIMISVFTYR
jgi:hypothetical protein